MAVKLTDKETAALAKKVQVIKETARKAELAAAAKKLLPEAKKQIAVLNALPDALLKYLYENRYRRDAVSPLGIATAMARSSVYDAVTGDEIKAIEADVILAAHDCSTMSALCKKLGI